MPKIGKPDPSFHRDIRLRWIVKSIYNAYRGKFGQQTDVNRELSNLCVHYMLEKMPEYKIKKEDK